MHLFAVFRSLKKLQPTTAGDKPIQLPNVFAKNNYAYVQLHHSRKKRNVSQRMESTLCN